MRDLIGFAPFGIIVVAVFAIAIAAGLNYWLAIVIALGVELAALAVCSLLERLCDCLFSRETID